MSLLATLLLPGKEDANYLPHRIGGDFHLLFSHDLCSWCSFSYDVGACWPGNEAGEETFLGFCLSFSPTDKLGCFIEEYNNFAQGETSCMSEIGISYMVHPRVQIDAYTDLDWKHPGKYNNVGIGVAWKIL